MAIDLFSHMTTRSDIARFQKHVEVDPVTGCHIWTGAKNKKGYGQFSVRRSAAERAIRPKGGNKRVLAHKWIAEQAHGPAAPGNEWDHGCCNPACVNLEHLCELTKAQNLALRGRVHLDFPRTQAKRIVARKTTKGRKTGRGERIAV